MKPVILNRWDKTLRIFLIAASLTLPVLQFPVQVRGESLLGMGVGIMGILDRHKTGYASFEYRPAMHYYRVRPWVGIEFADGFYYSSAGALMDFEVGKNWLLTPSFGAGFYDFNGDKLFDLGNHLEFRSSIELGYRFKWAGRLGLSISHISNGGVVDKNPGSELIRIIYYFPLGGD